jgi:hypothetical protein
MARARVCVCVCVCVCIVSVPLQIFTPTASSIAISSPVRFAHSCDIHVPDFLTLSLSIFCIYSFRLTEQ